MNPTDDDLTIEALATKVAAREQALASQQSHQPASALASPEHAPSRALVEAGYYKAGYYGDTGSQGLFNTPYCTAVGEEKQIGTNSFIWSSHALLAWPPKPKATEPAYKPPVPPCANQTFAWQYGQAPTNPPPTPNVDTDEALPGLPFWYP